MTGGLDCVWKDVPDSVVPEHKNSAGIILTRDSALEALTRNQPNSDGPSAYRRLRGRDYRGAEEIAKEVCDLDRLYVCTATAVRRNVKIVEGRCATGREHESSQDAT